MIVLDASVSAVNIVALPCTVPWHIGLSLLCTHQMCFPSDWFLSVTSCMADSSFDTLTGVSFYVYVFSTSGLLTATAADATSSALFLCLSSSGWTLSRLFGLAFCHLKAVVFGSYLLL